MANNHVEKQEKVEERVTTSERVEAFLSSAATRLQQVEKMNSRMGEDIPVVTVTREQQEALLGPHLALGKRCKTILSSEGILQNPLGRHEGKRVWGGGIVKLRMNQWIPWAIDQLVKEEQADKLDMQETGVEGITFTHRVTDIAQGDGLTSIMPVSWVANVRNVHTAAVPPWMVQTEEEYKKCNYRMPVVSSVSPARLTSKADKTRRDIFSELQSKSVCGQDWLPNFGGVWQEGPRSKTKQAFRKAVNAVKPTRDCDRDSRSKFHPSQLQGATPLPQVSPIDSQEPQPPAAVQDSVPEQKQATMRLSPPESRDNESQMKNLFDAKKQLLLAQKERLRAKMAVRRPQ
ncbi:unnamed protein product [Peronospora belbahrii]|nr:unnamed protein product [Peronospora belbahrii]